MEVHKEAFKRMFPNLAKEMTADGNRVSVNSVRSDNQSAEKHAARGKFAKYMPDVVDFLRRCDNSEQAKEVIDYMENRGEIDSTCAEKLRKQLKQKGVRSFGTKKEPDYYLKHGEP